MRPITTLALAFAGALASGCGQHAEAPLNDEPPSAPLPAIAAMPPRPSASPSVPTPPPARHIDTFAAISSEAWNRCEPKGEEPLTTSDIKLRHGLTNVCLERRMVAELDKVLVPLKAARSPRFRSLMKEQATYNRFADALGELVEQAMWISLDTGERTYGSCYDCGTLACETSSSEERLFYARALQAEDAAALAERIEAVQKTGDATLTHVRTMEKAAARWVKRLAAEPGEHDLAIGAEEWREIAKAARAVESGATELAASTCDGFPGLAESLGGAEACREKARRYFLAQCEFMR